MGSFEEEDLRDLMQELDELVDRARPVPRVRDQIVLDRESVYNVLDRMRFSLPFAIKTVRRLRQRREADGDPPLREPVDPPLDVLHDIDALDDLVHASRPMPLADSVRVERDRLGPILDRMRAVLIPLGQGLSDLKSIHPDSDFEPTAELPDLAQGWVDPVAATEPESGSRDKTVVYYLGLWIAAAVVAGAWGAYLVGPWGWTGAPLLLLAGGRTGGRFWASLRLRRERPKR